MIFYCFKKSSFPLHPSTIDVVAASETIELRSNLNNASEKAAELYTNQNERFVFCCGQIVAEI